MRTMASAWLASTALVDGSKDVQCRVEWRSPHGKGQCLVGGYGAAIGKFVVLLCENV